MEASPSSGKGVHEAMPTARGGVGFVVAALDPIARGGFKGEGGGADGRSRARVGGYRGPQRSDARWREGMESGSDRRSRIPDSQTPESEGLNLFGMGNSSSRIDPFTSSEAMITRDSSQSRSGWDRNARPSVETGPCGAANDGDWNREQKRGPLRGTDCDLIGGAVPLGRTPRRPGDPSP